MHYLNEFDPFAAEWLRGLMRGGEIPHGTVDERSIKDVKADGLVGYEQCHFFAGIGGWPLAFQLAGLPGWLNTWSGSCPCQPYSTAGKGKGQEDPRHLWPVWFPLIRECKPQYVFGEQVSAAIGHGWLDGVFADMEGAGYTGGAVVLGAHSVRAPHIRQRVFWGFRRSASGCSEVIRLPDSSSSGRRPQGDDEQQSAGDDRNGPWSDYTIGHYRDGKARRIGTGIQPLVNGIPSKKADRRMGELRAGLQRMGVSPDDIAEYLSRARQHRTGCLKGAGNAIVPQVAAVFLQAFMESF